MTDMATVGYSMAISVESQMGAASSTPGRNGGLDTGMKLRL